MGLALGWHSDSGWTAQSYPEEMDSGMATNGMQGSAPHASAGPGIGGMSNPWTHALAMLGSALISYQGQREANKTNKQIAEATNLFNAQEADKTRTWQALMSNTAFQRQVVDLERAGINPLLAAGMSGASTPSGATASGTTAHMENALSGVQSAAKDAISFGLQSQKQAADIALTKDQQMLTKAQTGKAAMETKVMSKGIPEADLKNSVYNWAKGLWSESRQANIQLKPHNLEQNQNFQKMQKLFQKGKP